MTLEYSSLYIEGIDVVSFKVIFRKTPTYIDNTMMGKRDKNS